MLTKGMVIATMTYGQFSQGDGAAIYLSHDTRGIRVMRQRLGQQISVSVIPSGGQGKESAEAYYVID
jgi:hypothetical protein